MCQSVCQSLHQSLHTGLIHDYQEMAKKLGRDIVGRYEVLNHDLDGRFEYCGRSSRGTPIYMFDHRSTADVGQRLTGKSG